MPDSKLNFNIVGHDRASQAFDKVAKSANQLEGSLGQAGERAGGSFRKGFNSKLEGLKQGALGALGGVGAAAGGLLVEGFKSSVQVGSMGEFIGAQLNLGKAEVEAAGKAAANVYQDGWGESLEQVKAAAVGIAQNLNVAVSDVDFQPLLQDALVFSEIFKVDVSESIRAVGRLMKTGLVESGTEGFNTLTRLFQEAGAQSDDLLDTLTEYPVQFKSLGLSAKDAAGLMIQGLEGGAQNSDKVADALKELRIRVTDLSAAKGLEQLGLDAEKMASAFAEGGPAARDALDTILDKLRSVEDPADRARLAVELFGTQGEDLATALNEMDLSKAREEIGSVGQAVNDAATTVKTSGSKSFEEFFRNVTAFGGELAGALTGDFAGIGEAWKDLTTTKIPGHATVAKGAMSGFSGAVADDMRSSRWQISDTGGMLGWLGDVVQGLPKDTWIGVYGNTSPFWRAVASIPNVVKNVGVTVSGWGSIFRAEGGLVGGFADGGAVQGFPSGGQVFGPGGPREDKIPAMLSNGEFVVNARDTRRNLDLLKSINSGRFSDPARLASGSAAGLAASSRVVVEFAFSGADQELLKLLRKSIRVRGGNVQTVLGGAR